MSREPRHDRADIRCFEMQVPVHGICMLSQHRRQDRQVQLTGLGAAGPVAQVNLGGGRGIAFGTEHTVARNERAQRMVYAWMGGHFVIYGPCVLVGISAREALMLLTETAGEFRVSMDTEEQP